MNELTGNADTQQQILTALKTNNEIGQRLLVMMADLNTSMLALSAKVNELDTKVTDLGTKVKLIESRQIDIEHKFVAMEVQMESRFFSLEVLIDKNAAPPSAKKNIPRHTSKGRA